MIRNGWILFGISVVLTVVLFLFGIVGAISAIVAALAGRMGMQSKNKPLLIAGVTVAVINVVLFGLASFIE